MPCQIWSVTSQQSLRCNKLSDIGHMVMGIHEPKPTQEQMSLKGGRYLNPLFRLFVSGTATRLLLTINLMAAIIYCACQIHLDESTFPNMSDIETMDQAKTDQFNYDHVRSEAKFLFEQASSLFPVNQLKQTV